MTAGVLFVSVYWMALAVVTMGAGAWLLWQALRPMPFGRDGLGVQEPLGALIGSVGFMHRWSFIDRLTLAGWAFVLLSIAHLGLRACAVLAPL